MNTASGKNLFYRCYGSGTKVLLCFHGYGMDGSQFEALATYWGKEYTFYSFDLFFHGKSQPELSDEAIENGLSVNNWKAFIEDFLKKENISEFSLAGHSIGARFCLLTTFLVPEKCKGLFLFVPDGLQKSSFYEFATSNFIGRKLFSFLLKKQRILLSGLNASQAFGLIPNPYYRYITSEINSIEKRKKVYRTWNFFKHIQVPISSMQLTLNKYHIPLMVFAGKEDRMISLKGIKRFMNPLKNKELIILDKGHFNITASILKELFGIGR